MDIEGSGVVGGFDKKKKRNLNPSITSANQTNNPKSGTSGTFSTSSIKGRGVSNQIKNPKSGTVGTFPNSSVVGRGISAYNFQPLERDNDETTDETANPYDYDNYDNPNNGTGGSTTAGVEEEETDPYAITDQQRIAAQNQTKLARGNRQNVWNQLSRQLATYDYADAQNRALADAQRIQNSRKNNADRFEAQRDLQSAALGLLGSMGNAMNGSATGNLMRMLESRNDKENNTYLAQLQQNQDAVENAYQEALNQNNVNRLDARNSADKAIDDIQSDWYANINNINPRLHDQYYGENEDGTKLEWGLPNVNSDTFNGGTPFESLDYQYDLGYLTNNNNQSFITGYNAPSMVSGYSMPDNTVRSTGAQANPSRSRNVLGPSNDYFAELMNRFNGYNVMRRR